MRADIRVRSEGLTSLVGGEDHTAASVHHQLQRAGLDAGHLTQVREVVEIHNLQYRQYRHCQPGSELQCDSVTVDSILGKTEG